MELTHTKNIIKNKRMKLHTNVGNDPDLWRRFWVKYNRRKQRNLI